MGVGVDYDSLFHFSDLVGDKRVESGGGASQLSLCDRVVLCLGAILLLWFPSLRAMFSRPDCPTISPRCLFRVRVNLAKWIGEMISANFLDAIDDCRNWNGSVGGRRRRKEHKAIRLITGRAGEGDRVDIVSCLPPFPCFSWPLSSSFPPPPLAAAVIVNLLTLSVSAIG